MVIPRQTFLPGGELGRNLDLWKEKEGPNQGHFTYPFGFRG